MFESVERQRGDPRSTSRNDKCGFVLKSPEALWQRAADLPRAGEKTGEHLGHEYKVREGCRCLAGMSLRRHVTFGNLRGQKFYHKTFFSESIFIWPER